MGMLVFHHVNRVTADGDARGRPRPLGAQRHRCLAVRRNLYHRATARRRRVNPPLRIHGQAPQERGLLLWHSRGELRVTIGDRNRLDECRDGSVGPDLQNRAGAGDIQRIVRSKGQPLDAAELLGIESRRNRGQPPICCEPDKLCIALGVIQAALAKRDDGLAIGQKERRVRRVHALESGRDSLGEPAVEVGLCETSLHVQSQPMSASLVQSSELPLPVNLPDHTGQMCIDVASLAEINPPLGIDHDAGPRVRPRGGYRQREERRDGQKNIQIVFHQPI